MATRGETVLAAADFLRRWFRAFRRTRPFWGGAWMLFGGYWVVHYSIAPIAQLLNGGFVSISAYVFGGGMMLCALLVWVVPSQRISAGIIGICLSVASLVGSNLGGFFLGMACGTIGGAMMLAWGPKKPSRRPLRRRLTTMARFPATMRSAGPVGDGS